jgi:hypothetical protein
MAIGIENYPNIDTTNPTGYPNGNIKDNTGLGDGTPIDVETTADIHQTFYKLLSNASITATNTPDNATNGYQYFEALEFVACRPFIATGFTFTNTGFNVWGNAGGGFFGIGFSKTGNNLAHLSGVVTNSAGGSPASTNVGTLPVGYRPSSNVAVTAYTTQSGGGAILLSISTAGVITSTTAVSGSESIYLDGISFRLA